jgi:hypothetical protein
MKPCREAAGVVPRSCHPPAAVECLVGSLLSPPPLPLHTSLGPCLCCCRASPHRVVAIEGAWEWGAPHSRCRRRWGWGYPLLPLSCRCGPGCSGNRVVVMVVAVWCTPRRRRGIGAHLVVLVAVGASCSFSRPWVLPRSSSWPCGAPRSSPWMPPHRSCGRVVAPTRPRGLGYTSLLVPMVVWSCGAPPSSLWPCGDPRSSSWLCGAPPLVVVAMWWPPLVLEAWVLPRLSSWPCGAPWLSLLPWMPPRRPCGRVVSPACPHGLGYLLARPYGRVVPPWSSLWPCPPGRRRRRGYP